MNKIMIILAGFVLLASACTSKQVTEKTASGLNPADFRMEVDGNLSSFPSSRNKRGGKRKGETIKPVF